MNLMKLIKAKSKEYKRDFQDLINLKVKSYIYCYPDIPPPNISYYQKQLTASERPTHYFEYYLIIKNNVTIGFLQLRYSKIRDPHLLGYYVFIKPSFSSDENLREVLLKSLPLIHDHITIVELFTTKILNDLRQNKFSFFGNIENFLVYQERINISDLDNFDLDEIRGRVQMFEEELKNKGFRLIGVKGGAFREEPRIDYPNFLKVVDQIWNDMPIEDADWGKDEVTEDTYDAIFKNISEIGGSHYSISIQKIESGEIAGYSDIYYYPNHPSVIHQGDTGVISKFRGNGFGRILKYKMLDYILNNKEFGSPSVWVTENANSNQHMLAINEELGYRHYYTAQYYDFKKEILIELLKQ